MHAHELPRRLWTAGPWALDALAALAATEALLVLVFLARPRALGDRTTLQSDLLAVAAAWWLGDGTRRRQDAIAAARTRAAELERARGCSGWRPPPRCTRCSGSALTGPSASTLPTWAGGLLFAAYGVALALLGTRLVVRRDLT